jgi:hypothetical protein
MPISTAAFFLSPFSVGTAGTSKAAATPLSTPRQQPPITTLQQRLDEEEEEEEMEEEYEIEDSLSFSPRAACEYVYDQVRATVTNPKFVVGVSYDDAAAVPVLDCDVQLRSVSVLKVSVW